MQRGPISSLTFALCASETFTVKQQPSLLLLLLLLPAVSSSAEFVAAVDVVPVGSASVRPHHPPSCYRFQKFINKKRETKPATRGGKMKKKLILTPPRESRKNISYIRKISVIVVRSTTTTSMRTHACMHLCMKGVAVNFLFISRCFVVFKQRKRHWVRKMVYSLAHLELEPIYAQSRVASATIIRPMERGRQRNESSKTYIRRRFCCM